MEKEQLSPWFFKVEGWETLIIFAQFELLLAAVPQGLRQKSFSAPSSHPVSKISCWRFKLRTGYCFKTHQDYAFS